VVLGLKFGGFLLVAPDPLPREADVAVVLGGSYGTATARVDEAVGFLREGRVDSVMVSVGAVDFWGRWFPDLVDEYLNSEYGEPTVQRIVLCEKNADSTREEAVALRECIENHGWESIIVVTSDYHTRRAGWIWEDVLSPAVTSFTLSVWGVPDGSFEPEGWWRNRRYAKTWLLEFVKLMWSLIEGDPEQLE
jgi:hypothetical protein